jgi:hypothetical protein
MDFIMRVVTVIADAANNADGVGISAVRRALDDGIKCAAVRANPHPVLMDASWYPEAMLPLLSSLVAVPWLRSVVADRQAKLVPLNPSAVASVSASSTKADTRTTTFTPSHALDAASEDFWCSAERPSSCTFDIHLVEPTRVAAVRVAFRPLSSFFGASGLSMLPELVELVVDGKVVASSVEFETKTLWLDAPVSCSTVSIRMGGTARWFAIASLRVFAAAPDHDAGSVTDEQLRRLVSSAPSGDEDAAAVARLPPRGQAALTVARDTLTTYLPHVMGRVNRVNYGILRPTDELYATSGWRRRLLAIPFRGKDAPSHGSEFAHPDITMLFTAFAFAYDGLREGDAASLLGSSQADLRAQRGPLVRRPAWVRWARWTSSRGLPLHIIDGSRPEQLAVAAAALRYNREAISHYCQTLVWPRALTRRAAKLTASGEEIGGPALFARRIGFSGTPSALLPRSLCPCSFDAVTEGKILATLADTDVVDDLELGSGWTVASLLAEVVRSGAVALIDVGALITGLTNLEVAHALLDAGVAYRGVAFFGEGDELMVVLAEEGRPVQPLSMSSLGPDDRFTFYDQVHTTGTDVVQPMSGKALMTLGKETTLRDASQGAWRMRKLGRGGQTVTMVKIPEVSRLVERAGGSVLAWLAAQSMRAEHAARPRLRAAQRETIVRTHGLAYLRGAAAAADTEEASERALSAAQLFATPHDVVRDDRTPIDSSWMSGAADVRDLATLDAEADADAAATTVDNDEAEGERPSSAGARTKRLLRRLLTRRRSSRTLDPLPEKNSPFLDMEVANEQEREVQVETQTMHDLPTVQPRAWNGGPRPTIEWPLAELDKWAVDIPLPGGPFDVRLSPNLAPDDVPDSRLKQALALATFPDGTRLAVSLAEADSLAAAAAATISYIPTNEAEPVLRMYNCAPTDQEWSEMWAPHGAPALAALVGLRKRRRLDAETDE